MKSTAGTFCSLGFITHPGFVLNSVEIKIHATPEKTDSLITSSEAVLSKPNATIQAIASLVMMLTASFPAAMFGPSHCRSLAMDKKTRFTRE